MKTCPEVYSAPETMAVPTVRTFHQCPTLVKRSISQLYKLTAQACLCPLGWQDWGLELLATTILCMVEDPGRSWE